MAGILPDLDAINGGGGGGGGGAGAGAGVFLNDELVLERAEANGNPLLTGVVVVLFFAGPEGSNGSLGRGAAAALLNCVLEKGSDGAAKGKPLPLDGALMLELPLIGGGSGAKGAGPGLGVGLNKPAGPPRGPDSGANLSLGGMALLLTGGALLLSGVPLLLKGRMLLDLPGSSGAGGGGGGGAGPNPSLLSGSFLNDPPRGGKLGTKGCKPFPLVGGGGVCEEPKKPFLGGAPERGPP